MNKCRGKFVGCFGVILESGGDRHFGAGSQELVIFLVRDEEEATKNKVSVKDSLALNASA